MPKRLIDDAIWRSNKLRKVQPESYRPEYAWLVPIANDHGSFECDAVAIWAAAYAANRPGFTVEDVTKILDELERMKLLYRWEVNGKLYGYWVGIDAPGRLPPPSQRYSTDPKPSADEVTRFVQGLPKGEPRAALGDAVTGLGFGVGVGFSFGLGLGDGNTASSSGAGSSDTTNTTPQNPTPTPPKFEIGIGNSALTLLAITEHIHSVSGIRDIRPNDPSLPILVRLTEERLAFQQTQAMTVAPEGWTEESGSEGFVEVPPGHPRYPSPDQPGMPGGLTSREGAASWALTAFHFALETLESLAEYIPDLRVTEPLPPGMIEFSEEDLLKVLRGIMGWPDQLFKLELSGQEIQAVMKWTFAKKSPDDYWPKHIKTLDDFARHFETIVGQYHKYMAKVPDKTRANYSDAERASLKCTECHNRYATTDAGLCADCELKNEVPV
jgi:hypothetical protein